MADGHGEQWWSLTTWCPESGVGHRPCAGSYNAVRNRSTYAYYRYLIDAMAIRTDLTADNSIVPWLESACQGAATASGPQNYRP